VAESITARSPALSGRTVDEGRCMDGLDDGRSNGGPDGEQTLSALSCNGPTTVLPRLAHRTVRSTVGGTVPGSWMNGTTGHQTHRPGPTVQAPRDRRCMDSRTVRGGRWAEALPHCRADGRQRVWPGKATGRSENGLVTVVGSSAATIRRTVIVAVSRSSSTSPCTWRDGR
jgi:hypothetical protein